MAAVICGHCGTDEFVEVIETDGGPRIAICMGPVHVEPRTWEPPKHPAVTPAGLPEGIAADLGLYDVLPALLNEGEWSDTVVIEHRYALQEPTDYGWMVKRWGHVAQGPRRYSTTSFIGSTLGDLSRKTNVTYRSGPGTGFFSYNSSIGFWTLQPVPATTVHNSWATYATGLGLDPQSWPLGSDG